MYQAGMNKKECIHKLFVKLSGIHGNLVSSDKHLYPKKAPGFAVIYILDDSLQWWITLPSWSRLFISITLKFSPVLVKLSHFLAMI